MSAQPQCRPAACRIHAAQQGHKVFAEILDDHLHLLADINLSNGGSGVLDMKPYLDFGNFKRIKDYRSFDKVAVAFDTIEWESGVDLDPEFVYDKCQNTLPDSTLKRTPLTI